MLALMKRFLPEAPNMPALVKVTAAHVAAASALHPQAPPPRHDATSFPSRIMHTLPDRTVGGRFEPPASYTISNQPFGSTRSPLSFMEAVFNTTVYEPNLGVTLGWCNPDIPLTGESIDYCTCTSRFSQRC